jgi:malonyl-CoA O-methyltransferase
MRSGKRDVVAAIIERDGRYLFGKRSPHKRSAPGYWCPICGSIEAGEGQAEAVVREVYEETGLVVRALDKVAACDTHDGSAVIHWWRVLPLGDEPEQLANDEHSELGWFTLDELQRLEPVFLEDVEIIERTARLSPELAVAGAYDRWSASYDTDVNPTRSMAADVLRGAGLELSGRRVVEVGCGTGRNTAWLAEHAGSVLGLDLSDGMLARARENVSAEHVRFERHDVTQPWPLPAGSADVVVVMLVLEHIASLGLVFEQAARALAPGGTLFVCELHPMRQMLGGQAHFGKTELGSAHESIRAYGHDVSEYLNAAIAAGLSLTGLAEPRDAGAGFQAAPRLLSVIWSLRAAALT